MHIFCTKCGKHIDVSLEELENQSGHLVCPQCLAEIDVDVDLFNGKVPAMPSDEGLDVTPSQQEPPSCTTPPPIPPTESTHQAETTTASTPPDYTPAAIDDVMRYCKHCGAFLKEGVNFCPKCGKYVRVTPPTPKPPLTPAQKAAAKLRATTPPAHQVPANSQSSHKPPKEPTYQASTVRQQPTSRYGAQRRTTTSKNKTSSKFSIHSIGGCLTLTIVAVALFFIIYIIIGTTYE